MMDHNDWRERKLKLIEAILSISNHEVEKRGYTEDQIVAMDFEDDGVMLFMTDGTCIKVQNQFLIGPIPDPNILH